MYLHGRRAENLGGKKMRNKYGRLFIVFTVAAVAVAALAIAAGAQMNSKMRGFVSGQVAGAPANTAISPLSEAEKVDLAYMREEEKLAHDVYLALGTKWNSNILLQIAESEQRHTESVAFLLEKYDVEDPSDGKAAGEFANKDLKALYDKLVADGSKSLAAALAVGATIEDLDIFDLDEALEDAQNPDVIRVFENLLSGSENHIRAFVAQLEVVGVSYKPSYISEEQYTDILEGNQGMNRAGLGKAGATAGNKAASGQIGATPGTGFGNMFRRNK